MRLALLAAASLLLGSLAVLAAPAEAATMPLCVGGVGYCREVVCVSQESEYECWSAGDYGTCVGTVPNTVIVCSPYIPYPF